MNNVGDCTCSEARAKGAMRSVPVNRRRYKGQIWCWWCVRVLPRGKAASAPKDEIALAVELQWIYTWRGARSKLVEAAVTRFAGGKP